MTEGSWRSRLPVIVGATLSLGGAAAGVLAIGLRVLTGATHRGSSGLEGLPTLPMPPPCVGSLGLPLALDIDGDGHTELVRVCPDGAWHAAGATPTAGALPVRPDRLCEDPSMAPRVWVSTLQPTTSGFYTLPSGTFSLGAEPLGCAPSGALGPCGELVSRGRCTPPGAPAPDAPRFTHGYTVLWDGVAYAAGLHGSGRVPSPAVVAFDPAHGRTRWERPLEGLDLRHGRRTGAPGTSPVTVRPPEVLEVFGDRVVVVYAVVEGHRMALLDAATGAVRWDARVPWGGGALGRRRVVLTRTEVVLVTDAAATVLVAATGEPSRAFRGAGQGGDL